jgi:catechol 2,3-dioxygenase-like lactoylglutathione lyase family enzyme
MGVNALHHVMIRVQDPERSRRFYEDVLLLPVMEIPVGSDISTIWRGRPASGTLLAIQVGSTFVMLAPPLEGADAEDRFDEHRVGVDHLAFGVESRDDLRVMLQRLTEAGVATAGIEDDTVLGNQFVCFRDPDNVQWEFWAA